MAFLISAVPMLSKDGQVLAIMPLGSFKSSKDQLAWELLRGLCRVEVLSEHGKRTFDGCYPRTALVRLTRRTREDVNIEHAGKGSADVEPTHGSRVGDIRVSVVRGWVQMHTLDSRAGKPLPLIHSKDLTAGFARKGGRLARSKRELRGPAVLLPRVGQPSSSNVCVIRDDAPIALSDCVIALTTETLADAMRLHALLRQRWAMIEELYGGTCARYITLERLQAALTRLGIRDLGVASDVSVTCAA